MNIINLNRKPVLEFDSGHGGSDRVNRGPKGWIEADGVLKISKKVASYLPLNKFDVHFTRTVDMTMGLTERAKKGAADKADLIISHHTNAGGGKGGTEVLYSVDIPKDKEYASILSQRISAALGIIDRGAKSRESKSYPGEDYYTMIDASQDLGIDHVFLIEYAFHDNAVDEPKLLNDTLLDKACKEEARTICEMFGISFVTPVVVVKPTPSAVVYRVRKSWADESSQIGAFGSLENAKELAIAKSTYKVYDSKGVQVYPVAVVVKPVVKPVVIVKPVIKVPTSGVVTATLLNVRTKASASSAKIGELKKGEKVRIASKSNGFYQIYFGDHGGYVSSEYIK